jgi:ABC-type polysaccharide/polyol phosphate transport system ATPase subunit
MPCVRFQNVSKTFSLHQGRALIASHLRAMVGARRKAKDTLYALRDVTFTLNQGESLALIGSNGAGKSTALSLIAGLSRPDEGTVEVNGRLAALLELGSGFHGDLTGAENVLLNAALLGMSRSEAREALPRIVEFAGLEEFIDEPIRTYSAGMVMRLAFSTATNVSPDILLIDELLAVGDQDFQKKCAQRLGHLRGEGRSLICVSHEFPTVLQLCDRAIWLDHGRLMMDGPVAEVVAAYREKTPAAAATKTR